MNFQYRYIRTTLDWKRQNSMDPNRSTRRRFPFCFRGNLALACTVTINNGGPIEGLPLTPLATPSNRDEKGWKTTRTLVLMRPSSRCTACELLSMHRAYFSLSLSSILISLLQLRKLVVDGIFAGEEERGSKPRFLDEACRERRGPTSSRRVNRGNHAKHDTPLSV